jgi:hypothetical protein
MLSVTAGAFLLVTWIATKALFFFLQETLSSDSYFYQFRHLSETFQRIAQVLEVVLMHPNVGQAPLSESQVRS